MSMNNTGSISRAQLFLSGGGEMGERMRAKDWSETSLGPPDNWPQILLSTLSIILNSRFPMFLFWGPEYICFYNDAYRPSLGKNGKHPAILGSKAEDYWQEIWADIKPLIDKVFAGHSTWNEDQLLPIYRNGKLEDVYWTFSYSPVKNEDGKVAGVFVTCTETTEKLAALRNLETSNNKFRDSIMQAPVAMCIFRGPTHIVETVNTKMLEIWDRTAEQVMNKVIFDGVPEGAGQGFEQILGEVYRTGKTFSANEVPVNLRRNGEIQLVYVNLIFEAFHEHNNEISGITVVATEVTDQVKAKETLQDSESQFRNLISQSPIGMAVFKGPDLVIEINNETMLKKIWRREQHEVTGRKLLDIFPELEQQKFPGLLKKIFETGTGFKENEALTFIDSHDGRKRFYLDYECTPFLENDKVSGIMLTISDVTEKVEAKQKIRAVAERLHLATEGTQLATWDLDLITFELIYSPRLIEIFGHHDKLEKLTHGQWWSYLHPEDRATIVDRAFDSALKTGVCEYECRIIHPDKTVHWIRTKGKVIFDDHRAPMRMLGTMIDITVQKQTEENLVRLAAIVESSDDAIIGKTLEGIVVSWNDSAQRIFGYTSEEMLDGPIARLIPKDRLNEEKEILSRLRKGERVEHFETKRLAKSGKLLDISLTISPIRDHNGIVIGASKIARDVTSQKRAERLIAENEERLKIVLDASELGTWEINLVNGEVSYSSRYLEILGYKSTLQPTHAELKKLLYPDDIPVREKAFQEAFKTGILNYETRIIREDGAVRWLEAKGKVFYNETNKPVKLIGTCRDITDEKLSKQKIEESERRFKTVADTAPVLIWMAGTDKRYNFFNKAWLQFTGRGADSELSYSWGEGIHPTDIERCSEIYSRNFDARREFYLEYRLRRNDGEYRWISDNGMPRFTAAGVFEGYIGACMDIHDRILFEEKLKESETRFRSVANSAPVMIWMTDLEKNAIFLNKCWSDFTGIPQENGLQKGWVSAVHPDDIAATSAAFTESYKSRSVYNKELRLRRKDGKYRWIQDHAVPRYDAEGVFLGYIGSSVDIQEQKFAKKELENMVEERTADLLELNDQLIKTNHELEQFAYVSSHDLQEPLRKIQTFAEMLSSSITTDEKSQQYLDKINSSAKRMSNLIKDLLNYSRLSKTDEQFVKTDLNEVLKHIKNDFELLIQQKNADIQNTNLPVINAIPIQINQLFYNLISNSLKFSEINPIIKISSRILTLQEQKKIPNLTVDGKYVHITFEDNGIGFSQAHADQIFVIFQRLNDKQKYSGTGIGLAMCKKIVENHHGHIAAKGEQDKGAIFDIYLPI
ncbi:MAG: PAS domain S-box protein [Bacteroidota bacterium]